MSAVYQMSCAEEEEEEEEEEEASRQNKKYGRVDASTSIAVCSLMVEAISPLGSSRNLNQRANAMDMYEFTATNCSTFPGTKYRTCHMEFSAVFQTEGSYSTTKRMPCEFDHALFLPLGTPSPSPAAQNSTTSLSGEEEMIDWMVIELATFQRLQGADIFLRWSKMIEVVVVGEHSL
ncbi:hypothetical protein MUK42_00178 [Musa troglodytarum]|uniref:Uncharacterized protein n=1 Tax=Musa troglodytarum TaxID=320322 RepID=A0A9E7JSG3_9LILI|nr:hypothetical protein MUK42_00178 [Musa troglodytarum]